ncbi:alpha/beta hydrolase [Rathayibacter sp. YIM 133350]|uniref:alpha/beta hydrolase n=1 Tax=Rathayibacter sp. YIM 133350 TaxID=3131992 RepID=UPI00307EF712
MTKTTPYDPELARARFIPRFSFGPRLAPLMRRQKPKTTNPGPGVRIDEIGISSSVSLHLIRPTSPAGPVPVLLWIHGGGHLFGTPEQDDRSNIAFVRELGIAVAAVRYRLGADAPAPASVQDCYTALEAVIERASEFGIDAGRLAIGGASAGGGIAAALVLYAHDRGMSPAALQLLVYPMLDDRTAARTDHDTRNARGWTAKSNHYGWATYLGVPPGSDEVSDYAAPARRADLTGLPPAWIGVGTVDIFHDEDVEYARRLIETGAECELHVIPGAFHGFDQMFPTTRVAQDFWRSQADALRRAGVASTLR